MQPIKPKMLKTVHWNPILNISTGTMASGVPDRVSGLIRQVGKYHFYCFIFAFSILVHSWDLGKWLPLYSINLETSYNNINYRNYWCAQKWYYLPMHSKVIEITSVFKSTIC